MNQIISNAIYKGERRNFTLDTYYDIMSKAFNDLEEAGPSYALNSQQKVTTFENGLKDQVAIQWYITAKENWNRLPINDQTFDSFYNEFSKYMNKFRTLSTQEGRAARIAVLDTSSHQTGRPGRGRGRGRGRGGRGRGRSGRRGRGRPRTRSTYNPYQMASNLGDFQPEAKNYTSGQWNALTREQQQAVQQLKAAKGWINGFTPPAGFVIGQNGYPTPSESMVAAIQSVVGNTNTDTSTGAMVPLPPPPTGSILPAPGIPPVIRTNPNQAGNTFGRSGSRNPVSDASATSGVSMVSINGQNYTGAIFDANGRRLN